MASVTGTSGNDTLSGTAADDSIAGLAGDDLIEASLGRDSVNGGDGTDIFNMSQAFVSSLPSGGTVIGLSLVFTQDQASDSRGGFSSQLSGIETINLVERSGVGASIDTGDSAFNFNIELGSGSHRVRGQAGAANETVTVSFADTAERIFIAPDSQGGITIFQFEGRSTPRTSVATTAVESIALKSLDTTRGVTVISTINTETPTTVSVTGTDYTDLISGGNERTTILVRGSATDADVYSGGAGADTFAILDVSRIGINGQITDFDSSDVISLRPAGADAIIPTFIGTSSFSGASGEIRYVYRDTATIIEADSNGDRVADQFLTIANGRFELTETASGQLQGRFLSSGINTINGTNGNDRLTGTSDPDVINGLAGNDLIEGGNGDDTIDGGAGTDTMLGGAGNDVFYVDDPLRVENGLIYGDSVNGGDGYDIIISSVDVPDGGGTSVEEIRAATGNSPINIALGYLGLAVGNDGNNILTTPLFNTDGLSTLVGGRGDDQYRIYYTSAVITENPSEGNDTVLVSSTYSNFSSYTLANGIEIETLSTAINSGTTGIALTGNAYSQFIIGDYGNNRLAGGGVASGGGDVLIGLKGDDTYVVDSTKLFIIENANEGNDVAIVTLAASNFVLNQGTSVETIQAASGTDAINITGSPEAQTLIGNEGANILSGAGGGDTLIGLGGDDVYQVRSLGDQVIEANGGGKDTVFATVSYNLGANEVEVLSTVVNAATDPINLIGNYATQLVIGNYGNNILNGGSGGFDTLIGLKGDDTYAVGDARVIVVENANEGTDTVVASVSYQLRNGASVETLAAQNRSGTEALSLTGNEVGQVIAGNEGANTIDGRGGADTLVGGGGADVFAFTTAAASGNADTILDFQAGTDKIGLASDVFAAVTDGGITAGEFVLGTSAQDGDDRLVYDAPTARLFFDADGSGTGAAILLAQLSAGTQLTASSFIVVPPVSELTG